MLFRKYILTYRAFIQKTGTKNQVRLFYAKMKLTEMHGYTVLQIVGYPQALKGYYPYYDCRPFHFTSSFLAVIFLNSFSICLQNFSVNTLSENLAKSFLFLLDTIHFFVILKKNMIFMQF